MTILKSFGLLAVIWVAFLPVTPIYGDIYQLPIVGKYEIHRFGPRSSKDPGRLVLGERWGLTGFQSIVDPVVRYAVWKTFIVGTTIDGCFILDVSDGSPANPEPHLYAAKAEWEKAIKEIGAPIDIELLEPDAVAASMPYRKVHPEEYLMMKGLLDLSDIQWSNVFLLGALIISFGLGMTRARSAPLFLLTAFLGLAASLFGQTFLLGGGPSAFVGMFFMPMLCCLAAAIGRMFERKHKVAT